MRYIKAIAIFRIFETSLVQFKSSRIIPFSAFQNPFLLISPIRVSPQNLCRYIHVGARVVTT